MLIDVFIENETGSNQKNLFDEKAMKYIKTVTVSSEYPYPYGFILNTTSGDGDNLDCFILTNRPLKSKEIVKARPIGMMEQFEDGKEDHNIIAVLEDEEAVIDGKLKGVLAEFVTNVFRHRKDKTVSVGSFYGIESAEKLIKECQDNSSTA